MIPLPGIPIAGPQGGVIVSPPSPPAPPLGP
jgi:hypothetical protein